ncbi:preprotein translocase subunit SecE [Schaalia sp. 19OD2882]|uniref:preprotein translocase subunit SecE n=1 Tax=Schaalia sp. 19OD2882 TaxID=2794089 RepID=UPI001C1EA7C3|nr:preprotein translocase subunit SecE [Schaalia sp. 19OD2882]QWW19290.1 preprotein translocase subunit SecE [Schaalia sp. 19OD2882]
MSDAEAIRPGRGTTAKKGRATRKRDASPESEQTRPGVLRRVVIFISQVIAELKKVTYPTPEETWTYFLVVTVFVAVIMVLTGLMDYGFGKLSAYVFG